MFFRVFLSDSGIFRCIPLCSKGIDSHGIIKLMDSLHCWAGGGGRWLLRKERCTGCQFIRAVRVNQSALLLLPVPIPAILFPTLLYPTLSSSCPLLFNPTPSLAACFRLPLTRFTAQLKREEPARNKSQSNQTRQC